MIVIDGSQGEGGGQVLRSSLALSIVTRTAFRIENIRARRKTPGLLRQHLTAVEAAAQVGYAIVEGAHLGSQALSFIPFANEAKDAQSASEKRDFNFAIGTAGSTSLVLQTVLPPLLLSKESSRVRIEGGTHNPFAPPFEFLNKAFAPVLRKMGAQLEITLERHGFYPAGGGRICIEIEPCAQLKPVYLETRGEIKARRARACVANLPVNIAERELTTIKNLLAWSDTELEIETINNAHGAGNYLTLEIEAGNVTEVFTGIGARGVTAEAVAESVCAEAANYLSSEAATGEHLADQLVLPLALAGGGSFTTCALSSHLTTNIETVKNFINVEITTEQLAENLWRIMVK